MKTTRFIPIIRVLIPTFICVLVLAGASDAMASVGKIKLSGALNQTYVLKSKAQCSFSEPNLELFGYNPSGSYGVFPNLMVIGPFDIAPSKTQSIKGIKFELEVTSKTPLGTWYAGLTHSGKDAGSGTMTYTHGGKVGHLSVSMVHLSGKLKQGLHVTAEWNCA